MRDTSGTDGDIETESGGSYDAASSQLSRDEDDDGGPRSLAVHTTNHRSWSWVRLLNVLELPLLALVLVLEEEQVESDELELKREAEVDESTQSSPPPSPQMTQTQT